MRGGGKDYAASTECLRADHEEILATITDERCAAGRGADELAAGDHGRLLSFVREQLGRRGATTCERTGSPTSSWSGYARRLVE